MTVQRICIAKFAFIYVWMQSVHVEEYKDQLQLHIWIHT